MDDEELRKQLLTGFEYSYLHDSWVHPLEEALAGVTAAEAGRRPTPTAKSIWDIVLHLAVWNENIVERVTTGEATHPTEGAWPAPAKVADDAAWEAAKKRLWDSLDGVRQMLETSPMDKILQAPYGIADLLCRLTHNGYHLGQITKMREDT